MSKRLQTRLWAIITCPSEPLTCSGSRKFGGARSAEYTSTVRNIGKWRLPFYHDLLVLPRFIFLGVALQVILDRIYYLFLPRLNVCGILPSVNNYRAMTFLHEHNFESGSDEFTDWDQINIHERLFKIAQNITLITCNVYNQVIPPILSQ